MPPRAPATRSQAAPAHCPVCLATAIRRRYALASVTVWDCRGCGLGFLFPLPSVEEIQEEFATLYSEGDAVTPELGGYYDYCFDTSDGSPVMARCEGWLDLLERYARPGTLLDVGCGTGLFLAVARRRGWKSFGIDECAEATRHAREHFGLEVWDGEFADFATGDRQFDAITGWDILEHSRAPVELLRTIRRCLAPGGVVGLSTPNQRSILDVVAGGFYRLTGGRLTAPLEKFYIDQHFLYFSPATLAGALGRAGLAVAELVGEATDLRRLTLSPPKRLVLQTLFAVGRATGLDNRLFAVARAKG